MKYLLFGLITAALFTGYVIARPMDQTGVALLPYAEQGVRACIYQTGGWTTVDCSAAVAYSAELEEWSRYVIQCTEDAYIAFSTAGSGADADTNDGYLPKGAWTDFFTSDLITYYSCLSSAAAGKCRHIECK